MKRSDMELIIAESLIEPRFPEDALKEAAMILARLERYGMLPPETRAPSWHRQTTINVWDQESPMEEQKDLNEENKKVQGL